MKAIILAAGLGTRLRPLSDYLPKPLMPILGRPLLWHTIRKLKNSGVTAMGINVHHNTEKIIDFLNEHNFGVKIEISHEEKILGVAGGIKAFQEFLRGEEFFIVHNGDILSNIPVEKVVNAYRKKKSLIGMVLHNCPSYNNITIEDDGAIIDIRDSLKAPQGVKKLAYTGIACMHTDLLDYIPEGTPSYLIPLCLRLIAEGTKQITGIAFDGYLWRDIGTIHNYFATHRDILLEKKPLLKDAPIPEDGMLIDNTAIIEEGANLKGFLSAGKRCVIKRGCTVENCIIWDDAIVENNAMIKNAVVGRDFTVYAG